MSWPYGQFGVDPAVLLLVWASLVLTVMGGMWAVFYALMRQLGWMK